MEDERRVAGKQRMLVGGVVCAAAIIAGVATYVTLGAGHGIAWGAVLFGGALFVSGLIQARKK